MTYAGIQMFMDKLNQLINCNEVPFINNPEIIRERPQFQLLYDDLASMIQTVFIHEHQDLHELEKVNDLKKRFIYAAEEAQYIVDMFLSDVHNRDFNLSQHGDDVRRSSKSVHDLFLSCVDLFLSCFHTRNNSEDFNPSLSLLDARRSFKFVKEEFMSMRTDNMKMDSSERTLNQAAAVPISISKRSKKLSDEIVVGLDRDVELIRDKLVEDHRKLDVVSVVGMGGIGKTTLATKVFNDDYVKHYFYVRLWATVSQTYDKRAVLIQILESIRAQLGLEKASDSRLREMVHKHLMGRRYLIVIDDIWDIEAWDNLKLFFPHDNTGSRILLTTRLTKVAKHANSDGLIHHLGYLNKERSWKLLSQKVFYGKECPQWSIKPGMQIAENCQGLPLAVVVIAGVLAKEACSEKFWVEIAERTGSYIVGEGNGCLETLALSYSHLPVQLRECFLYLGGFPEDYMFEVQRLMWLWVAEGFIEEDGNRSLENIAEGYLMDLIDRNLVIVAKRSKTSGGVKACKVHDLVIELCLKKAKEEQFILQTERLIFTTPYKPVRKFINTYNPDLIHLPTQNLRSILWFRNFGPLRDDIAKYFNSFLLLRVLDLQNCRLNDFSYHMKLLVHLRYLAIWNSSKHFPSSICKLWNLQTLIYITEYTILLPSNISDLVNLRHLWSWYSPFVFGSIEKPMNLQTISHVKLKDDTRSFQKYFPCIKELTCTTSSDMQNDFKSLSFIERLITEPTCNTVSDKENDFKSFTYLERLKLWSSPVHGKNHITFPATLKTLKLLGCQLPWSDMSIIQSLPNLQVLKLQSYAFEGSCWNTGDHEFPQLNFLRLKWLDIKQWEVYSTSFPCLKQLEISSCEDLEEIPLEIGDIPTLEHIKIWKCRQSLDESVRRIQEEQQDMGNYDLKIYISQKEQLFDRSYL